MATQQTARGFPQPAGTERVMDGDNEISALSARIEAVLFGSESYKRFYRAALIALTSGTSTPIPWDSAGAEGALGVTLAGSNITVPATGLYDVHTALTFQGSAAATGSIGMDIRVAGVTKAWTRHPIAGAVNAAPQLHCVALAIPVNAGQAIDVAAVQTSGAALNVLAGAYNSVTIRRVA